MPVMVNSDLTTRPGLLRHPDVAQRILQLAVQQTEALRGFLASHVVRNVVILFRHRLPLPALERLLERVIPERRLRLADALRAEHEAGVLEFDVEALFLP